MADQLVRLSLLLQTDIAEPEFRSMARLLILRLLGHFDGSLGSRFAWTWKPFCSSDYSSAGDWLDVNLSTTTPFLVDGIHTVASSSDTMEPSEVETLVHGALKLLTRREVSDIASPSRPVPRLSRLASDRLLIFITDSKTFLKHSSVASLREKYPGCSISWFVSDFARLPAKQAHDALSLRAALAMAPLMLPRLIIRKRAVLCDSKYGDTGPELLQLIDEFVTTLLRVQPLRNRCCKTPAELFKILNSFHISDNKPVNQSFQDQVTGRPALTSIVEMYNSYLYGLNPVVDFISTFAAFKDNMRVTIKGSYAVRLISDCLEFILKPVDKIRDRWMRAVTADILSSTCDTAIVTSFRRFSMAEADFNSAHSYCQIMLCRELEMMVIIILEMYRSACARDKHVRRALDESKFNIGTSPNLHDFLETRADELIDFLCIQFSCLDMESEKCLNFMETAMEKEPGFLTDIVLNNRYSTTVPKITKLLKQKFSLSFFSPAKSKPLKRNSSFVRRSSFVGSNDDDSIVTSLEEVKNSSETGSSAPRNMLKMSFLTVNVKQPQALSHSSQELSQTCSSEKSAVSSQSFYQNPGRPAALKKKTRKRVPKSNVNAVDVSTPSKIRRLDENFAINETPTDSISDSANRSVYLCTPSKASPALGSSINRLYITSEIVVPETPLKH